MFHPSSIPPRERDSAWEVARCFRCGRTRLLHYVHAVVRNESTKKIFRLEWSTHIHVDVVLATQHAILVKVSLHGSDRPSLYVWSIKISVLYLVGQTPCAKAGRLDRGDMSAAGKT
jgi:hypothetical protein